MPQGDIEPRRLTDDTTFEERHPKAPELVDERPPVTAASAEDPVTDTAPGRFGFVPDVPEVHEPDEHLAATATESGPVPVANPDLVDRALAEKMVQEARIDAEGRIAEARRLAAAEARHLATLDADRRVAAAQGVVTDLRDSLEYVTTGDGLVRSPLLDNPNLDTTDPSTFRGSIITVAVAFLAFLAAYGFGLPDGATEPLLILLGTGATAYSAYSIRKRAYSPVTTAKLVDTAYKAGLQGDDRPRVA